MSVLGSDHTATGESCFVVSITQAYVQAWLLVNQAGSITIAQTSGVVPYTKLSELTIVTDTALQELGPEAEQVEQIVFCFSPEFIVSDTLASDKKDSIDSLISQLRLKPIGFVSLVEALGYQLIQADHQYRGVAAAVFAEHIELQLIEAGQVVSQVSQTMQDSIEETVRMAIQQLISSVTSLEAINCSVALFGGKWSAAQWQAAVEHISWNESEAAGEVSHHCQVLSEAESLELGVAYASKVWVAALASEDPVLRASAETFGSSVGMQLVGELDTLDQEDDANGSADPTPKKRLFQTSGTKKNPSRRTLLAMASLGVVLGLLFLLVAGTGYLLTQSVFHFQFVPQTKPLSNSAYFTLSSTLSEPDLSANKLPASELTASVSQTETGPTTGTGYVGEKATGTVQLLNKVESEKTLSAGTELTTAGGVVFVLNDQVTLPPASVSTQSGGVSEVKTYGKAESQVTAKEIGSEGNIESLTALRVGEYAESTYSALAKDTFTGGSKAEVSVVTEQDIAHVTEVAKQNMIKQAEADFATQATPNQVVSPTVTLSALVVTPSAKVGDQAESITVETSATATALVFDKQVLKSVAGSLLEADVPAGFQLLDDSIQLLSDYESTASESGKILVDVTALAQQSVPQEQVLAAITGQKFGEIDPALQRAGLVGKSSWTLSPAVAKWLVTAVPTSNKRVVIAIGQDL